MKVLDDAFNKIGNMIYFLGCPWSFWLRQWWTDSEEDGGNIVHLQVKGGGQTGGGGESFTKGEDFLLFNKYNIHSIWMKC